LSSEYSQEVLDLHKSLDREAEAAGYHLNPDSEFVLMLADGLLRNRERYGYMLCPCRMGEGEKELDLDIICPCDYRDTDLDEYGQCY
jgi:ferredoxin-thioredoxin reductase catalytic chain